MYIEVIHAETELTICICYLLLSVSVFSVLAPLNRHNYRLGLITRTPH